MTDKSMNGTDHETVSLDMTVPKGVTANEVAEKLRHCCPAEWSIDHAEWVEAYAAVDDPPDAFATESQGGERDGE